MPTKFRASATTLKRGTKVAVTEHYYIKNISKEELFEEFDAYAEAYKENE